VGSFQYDRMPASCVHERAWAEEDQAQNEILTENKISDA